LQIKTLHKTENLGSSNNGTYSFVSSNFLNNFVNFIFQKLVYMNAFLLHIL